MEAVHVSRDRLNVYRLARQRLEPRGTGLADVLEAVGFLPTREAALLSVRARLPGFTGVELTRAVFTERVLVEMAALRDQSLLVPRALAPVVLRCPSPFRKDAAEKALNLANLAAGPRLALRYGVIEILDAGPFGYAGLLERLLDAGGDAERYAGREGVLPAVLSLLQLEGQILRTNLSGDLLRGKAVYVLSEKFFGTDEVTGLDPEEAVRTLCSFYFRVHGPATVADFGWWSGVGGEDAADAFRSVKPSLVRVEADGVPYGLWLPEPFVEDLELLDPGLARPVALAPFRDPWLSSHEGRVGRFLSPVDVPRLLPGPALPAALITGFAAGRWSLDARRGEVAFEWFREPLEAFKERAAEAGRELGAFAAAEMPDLAPLSVPGPGGPFRVYGDVRNSSTYSPPGRVS